MMRTYDVTFQKKKKINGHNKNKNVTQKYVLILTISFHICSISGNCLRGTGQKSGDVSCIADT